MIFKILLYPLSIVYGTIIFIRNLFFDIGIFRISKTGVPVISVGNLTAGGTGKTPVVEFILRYLLKKGLRVAVISRGYKRTTKGTVVVSDGESILVQPDEAGDELFQIARKFQKTIIIADENRVRAAEFAIKKFNCSIIVLDDAFQHRRIYRDLDIVLIDATRLPHKEFMMPAGFRREPLKSAKRADIIIFTRANNVTEINYLLYDSIPSVYSEFRTSKIIDIKTGNSKEIGDLSGKKCLAFCGIGNPDSFKNILNDASFEIAGFKRYPDHYYYEKSDIRFLIEEQIKSGAEMIITTEKDFIRLMKFKKHLEKIPVYYIEIEFKMISDEKKLLNKIDNLTKQILQQS